MAYNNGIDGKSLLDEISKVIDAAANQYREAGEDAGEAFAEGVIEGIKKNAKETKSEITKIFEDFNKTTNNFKSRKSVTNAEWTRVLGLSKELMKSERYADSVREKLSDISVTLKNGTKVSGLEKVLEEWSKVGGLVESVSWAEAGKNYRKKPSTKKPKVIDTTATKVDPVPVVKTEEKKQEAIDSTTDAVTKQSKALKQVNKEAEATVKLLNDISSGAQHEPDGIRLFFHGYEQYKKVLESIVEMEQQINGLDSSRNDVKTAQAYLDNRKQEIAGDLRRSVGYGLVVPRKDPSYEKLLSDVNNESDPLKILTMWGEAKKATANIKEQAQNTKDLTSSTEALAQAKKEDAKATKNQTQEQEKLQKAQKQSALSSEEIAHAQAVKSRYLGDTLKGKSDFQRAISNELSKGNKAVAAKLFSQYQDRFKDGKFDPFKTYSHDTDWVENYSKYLEQADRHLAELDNRLQGVEDSTVKTQGKFKSFIDDFNDSKNTILSDVDLDNSKFYTKDNYDFDGAEARIDAARQKMESLKDEALAAKEEYDKVFTMRSEYLGWSLKRHEQQPGYQPTLTDGKKSEWQTAIKSAWAQENKPLAAKLYEQYKIKFPKGTFDPSKLKMFGSDWVDNYSKYLEQANRHIVELDTIIDGMAKDYGKYDAYDSLKRFVDYNQSILDERKRDKLVRDVVTNDLGSRKESAKEKYATDDTAVAQENLNKALEEYNRLQQISNEHYKKRHEMQKLIESDARDIYSNPLFDGYKSPVEAFQYVNNQFADADFEADRFAVTELQEAIRVAKELGVEIDESATMVAKLRDKHKTESIDGYRTTMGELELYERSATFEEQEKEVLRRMLQRQKAFVLDNEKSGTPEKSQQIWDAKIAQQNEYQQELEETVDAIEQVGKTESNIIYHAGDLSNPSKTMKSLPLGNVAPIRGRDSVFNGFTGLYTTEDVDGFWGNEWDGAPISSIDISHYKMFDARNNDLAKKAQEFFGDLNSTIYGYHRFFDFESGEMKTSTDVKTVEALYDDFKAVFKNIDLDFESFKNFVVKSKAIVEGHKFEEIEVPDIDMGVAKSNAGTVLQGVSQDVFNYDSFQTQLLKLLGFEGIDLRGTKFNGTYTGGTVIFDVKPESLKAVNEKWSDVMARNGYEIDETNLQHEEKRRQLAFETAKAYSQQTEEAKKSEKSLEGFMSKWKELSAKSDDENAFGIRHASLLEGVSGKTPSIDYDTAYNQLIADEEKYQQEVAETKRINAERAKQLQAFTEKSQQMFTGDLTLEESAIMTDLLNKISLEGMSAADAVQELSNALKTLRGQQDVLEELNDVGQNNKFREYDDAVAVGYDRIQKLQKIRDGGTTGTYSTSSLLRANRDVWDEVKANKFFVDVPEEGAQRLDKIDEIVQAVATKMLQKANLTPNDLTHQLVNIMNAAGGNFRPNGNDIAWSHFATYDDDGNKHKMQKENGITYKVYAAFENIEDLNADIVSSIMSELTKAGFEGRLKTTTGSAYLGNQIGWIPSTDQLVVHGASKKDQEIAYNVLRNMKTPLSYLGGGIDTPDGSFTQTLASDNIEKYVRIQSDASTEVQKLEDHINNLGDAFKNSEQCRSNFDSLVKGITSGSITASQAMERMSDAYEEWSNSLVGSEPKEIKDFLDIDVDKSNPLVANAFDGLNIKDWVKGYVQPDSRDQIENELYKLAQALVDQNDDAYNAQLSRIADFIVENYKSREKKEADPYDDVFKHLEVTYTDVDAAAMGEQAFERAKAVLGNRMKKQNSKNRHVSTISDLIRVLAGRKDHGLFPGITDNESDYNKFVNMVESFDQWKIRQDGRSTTDVTLSADDAQGIINSFNDNMLVPMLNNIAEQSKILQQRTEAAQQAKDNLEKMLSGVQKVSTHAVLRGTTQSDFEDFAKQIADDSGMELGAVTVSRDSADQMKLATMQLVNKELAQSITYTYELQEISEGVTEAVLKGSLAVGDTSKALEKLEAKERKAAQKQLKDNTWLLGQRSKLDTQQRRYTSPDRGISGDLEIMSTETSLPDGVKHTIESLTNHIRESIKKSFDGNLTDEMRQQIISDIGILENEIKVRQNEMYSSTTMKSSQVQTNKDAFKEYMKAFEARAKKSGVFDSMKADIDSLNAKLNEVGDSKGLNEFVDQLKIARNKFQAEVAQMSQTAKTLQKQLSALNTEENAYNKTSAGIRAVGEDNLAGSFKDKIAEYENAMISLRTAMSNLKVSPDDVDGSLHKAFDDALLKAKNARLEIDGVLKESQKLQKIGNLIKTGYEDVSKVENLKTAMIEFVNSAFNGEAKIQGFNKEGTQMYVTLNQGADAVENVTVALDKASGHLNAFSVGTSRATNEWEDFKTQAVAGAKNLIGMYVGFQEGVQAVRAGVNYVKEIDLAMTELKKVTDETDASYKQFLEDAGSTSAIIGSTVSDFTNASATFARLGYSLEESASMAETAIIYKNVADGLDTVEESSESIISTMMAFGIEANDTMSIIDRFNAVGNAFAITSAGIGDALQRSASALFAAGNTIDESVALVTAANSVIQNPEQVGTALKTLALRLRGAKVELEEAGLETDNMAESTSTLQAKLNALTHGKVNIMEDADTFKSTTQILREMSEAWEDMTDIERASALELMGGKRQANILASVITNFETVEDVIETSMNSAGSAMAENEKWLDSIEGKTYQFTNALQTMWSNMLNSEVIKGFLDFGTGAIKLLDTSVGKVIALVSALTLMSKFKGFSIAGIFQGLGDSIKAITTAQQTLQTLTANPATKFGQGFDPTNINLYASAVSNLTAKQQAHMLSSAGLSKAQIQLALQYNGLNDDVIREATAHVFAANAKDQEKLSDQELLANKILLSAASLRLAGDTNSLAAAEYLEAHASELAAAADAKQLIMSSQLTPAAKAAALASIGQANANMTLAQSIKALYAANPIGFWLTLATTIATVVVSAFNRLKEKQKEVAESAQKAIDAYKDAQATLADNKKSIDNISSEYEQLANGVDKFGNNINLTTDEYARYNEIVNDIASMFPQMVAGYTAEGNAILSTKGNVEALTKAYEEKAEAARNAIILGGDDVFENAKNSIEDAKEQIDAYNVAIKMANGQTVKSAKDEYGDSLVHDAEKILKDYGFDANYNKYASGNTEKTYGNPSKWNRRTQQYERGYTYEEEAEHAERLNKLMLGRNDLLLQQEGALSKVNTVLQAYLDNNATYAGMEDEAQSAISSIVSALDPADFDYDDDKMEAFILTNIIAPIHENKDGVQEALNNLLTLDEDATSYNVYDGLRSALLTAIANLPAETQDAFKKAFGLDGDSGYDTYLNHAKKILQDDFDDMASELTLSELQIVDKLDVPDGTLLTWEELKQKIAEVKNTLGGDITSVKTYSVLAESAESYNNILAQTSEIVADNTEVTQEYKDSLADLGISAEEINECFDDQNPLVVKNAKALNKLVKEANKNVAANVKLAKSNARLDYYQLVKQLGATLDETKKLDGATRDAIYSTLEQIDAVEKALYQYQLLEDTLLGVNNAFDEFAKAQEIDSLNTYGDSYVEMAQTMYDGLFKTGQVGTEQFWASVEALIPTEVYQHLTEDADRMKAIYEYYNKNVLPTLKLDEDQLSLDYDAIENFVKEGLGSGVFTGDVENFDLVEGMNLERAAELMGMTEAQAYALFAELDKYNTAGNEHSFLSQLDDSLEGRITNITNDLEDLNKQKLALLEDGGYEKNKKAIDEINDKLAQSETELNKLGQQAYTTWQEYTKNGAVLAALSEVEDKQRKLTQEESNQLGLEWDEAKELTVQQAYDSLLAKQLELEEPTVLTAQLAIDSIDTQIAELEALLADPKSLEIVAKQSGKSITEIKEEMQQQIQALKEDKAVIATTFGIELSEEDKKTLEEELNAIESITIHDKTFKVILNGASEVMAELDRINNYDPSDKTVTTTHKVITSNEIRTVHIGGGGRYTLADGTVHTNGSAYKGGSLGAPRTETALVGELGPEMLVRNGRWMTVGDNGAEFTQVKKGDIIFNHKQTEDLLSKGYVTGRGKLHGGAFASGTAYSGLWNPTSPDKPQSNKPGRNFSTTGDELTGAASDLSDAASDISDTADEFREVFDWIEVRLEEINEDISLRGAELENEIGYKNQNKVVDQMLDLNQKLYNNLLAGANKYYAYAEKLLAKVPAEYRKAAKDGTIAIEEFVGEVDEKTLNAIQEYREWVQKGDDATQQAEETLTEISSLAKQAIDNIASDYDNKTSLNDNKTDQLDAYNALLETDNGFESENVYKELISINNANIKQLKQQRNAMQSELNAQVEAGNIKKYSQDWYDAVNDIAAVDTEIIELTTDTENYQDAINELHWEKFDALMNHITLVAEETENLIDIISNKDLVNESGYWTDEGITSLGLYAQQMEVAEVQAKKYKEEIDYLNKNWQKLGYTEEEYIEKLDELKSGQYDAIQAYHDSKDAIVDLNKERIDAIKDGIEKEIEAYEELIEKKKEELDAEKDLYDFQKSVMEQEKDIADLERQLAALSADNSASARAKRAQLEAELTEAQAALQESYYERSISNQQEALDKELENFQEEKDKEMEGWDEYLENTEQVVADSLSIVQANTEAVYTTLQALSQEYSLSITKSLTSPWHEGSNAIQSFSEKFGLSMSATVEELMELELQFKETMLEIEQAGIDAASTVKENAQGYTEAEYQKPKKEEKPSGGDKSNDKSNTAGLVSSISEYIRYGNTGSNVKKLQRALNDLGYGNSGTSGLDGIFGDLTLAAVKKFQKDMGIASDGIVGPETKKKFKVKGYAKGSTGVSKDQLALIDELGDELLIRAKNGRLTYMEKGTGIIPEDLTSNLMGWGKLDPSIMLDRNRPSISAMPEIHNTEIHVDNSIAELIHIDNCSTETIPDVKKIVNEALEKHTMRLNQSLRKYTR